MRITETEKKALYYALDNINGDIYIFGSRVDDNKKGGDIDILILLNSSDSEYKVSRNVTNRFFKKCEEKIDVVVFNKNNITDTRNSFINVINKVRFNLEKINSIF